MVIDSSVVINNPHDGDFRIKKREDAEKIKPVERSGSSNESENNMEKDKIKEKRHETRRFGIGDMYNKNGAIERERNGNENTGMKATSIDLLV
jgi:hypothetical protein